MAVHDKPLLLVDDNNILSIINEGEFKCYNLPFDEAKVILEARSEYSSDVRCLYTIYIFICRCKFKVYNNNVTTKYSCVLFNKSINNL